MLREALRKSQGHLPDGRSAEDYVGQLLAMVVDEQSAREKLEAYNSQHASKCTTMEGVIQTIFQSKSTLEQAQLFLRQNPGAVESHPAFLRFMSTAKTVTCTCDDEDADEECNFHGEDIQHTIQDLFWGFSTCLREVGDGGECVPTSVGCVGTAALAVLATSAKTAVEHGAAEKEKPSTPSDIVGKYGQFLLQDVDTTGGQLNEQMIEGMIVCRAVYLLRGLRQMIEMPSQAGEFICVSDVENVACFAGLLDYLCSKNGKYYVIEMESRYHLSHDSHDVDSSGSPTNSWCSAWSKVFSDALKAQALAFRKAKKSESTEADAAESGENPKPSKRMRLKGPDPQKEIPQPPDSLDSWKQFLPLPVKIFQKTLMDGVAGMGSKNGAAGDAAGVKQEEVAQAGQKEADPAAVELFTKTPTIASIYGMHEVPGFKTLNALDVLCIGSQIQNNLLSYATLLGCNSAATLVSHVGLGRLQHATARL